jgi:FKBP-type peptidyl-prolyl cis-trans isomerase
MIKQRSILFNYIPSTAILILILFFIFSINGLDAQPKYKSTKTGLKYNIITKVKKGAKVQPLHTVQILFTSTLEDGTPIASSADRNNPLEFIYGNGEVLKGWEEAISMMKIGEKGSFLIPPSLAYGDKKAGKVPPNSTIKIDIELIGSYKTFYNTERTDYTKTATGLKYITHNKKTSGEAVKAGNYVVIHYTGYVIEADGKRKVFDSSRKNKGSSIIQCGVKKFINGLDEGIMLGNIGDSITIIIPPALGYGAKANQLVPANSTLGFDIFIESQFNPLAESPKEMIRKEGFSYGFMEKKSEKNAVLNDVVNVNLIGYYLLPNGVPFIFESSYEKQQTQTFRLGRALENPAWLYVLQQCGKGDKVKFMMDPEIARSELKKLIPENVSVFFEFEIKDILPPSFLPVENIAAKDLGEGLKLILINEGIGEAIDSTDLVLVHYTGFTADSLGAKKVFDSSFDRGTPFKFVVGAGEVIKGWDKGLIGRKQNEQFRLVVPAELGYGKAGVPPLILQDETLYFDMFIVQVLKLKDFEKQKN